MSLWKRTYLSIWVPLGNLKGACLPGFREMGERGLWDMSVFPWERCEWNSEGGLLYSRLRETCNGSLWKRNLSFIGLHKGNLRHLVKWGGGLASMFNGPEPVLDILLCHE